MTVDDCLDRFGLNPTPEGRVELRAILEAQVALERAGQGRGDTELMRLCCVQLFNAGLLEDVALIWRAKTASMDADASIDIQLLCGAGLDRTKEYLSRQDSKEARAALERLEACEAAGDFTGFSPSSYREDQEQYYSD